MNLIIRCLNQLKRWLDDLISSLSSSSSTPIPSQFPNKHQNIEPQLNLASSDPPKYKKNKSVFTERERLFFGALRDAVDGKYEIFPKVRLGDFIFLANEPENRKFHNSQIFCKHIDYLLCDNLSFKPLLAIELDDSTHNQLNRRNSDEFKDQLFKSVGLPLSRFRVQSSYSAKEIGKTIADHLKQFTDTK